MISRVPTLMQFCAGTIVASLLLLSGTKVANADVRMSLKDAMSAAADNPQVRAARARAHGAESASDVERRLALLPTVSIVASGNLRDRNFTLNTPMGRLPLGDNYFSSARLRISQPLFDPSRLLYTSAADKQEAQAAHYVSRGESEKQAMIAAESYLNALSTRALRTSSTAYVEALRSQRKEVETLVSAERAIPADQLTIELALARAQLQSHTLEEHLKIAELALGQRVGIDEAVHVNLDGLSSMKKASSADIGQVKRNDLMAIRSQRNAEKKRLSGLRAELLPKLVFNGDMIFSDQGPQAETYFLQGSINLVWVPYASGTRSLRKKVHQANISALTRQHEDLQRGVRVQLEQSQSEMRIAQEESRVASISIAQARELVRVTRDRYAVGRENISQVIEVEAMLRDSLVQKDLAEIEIRRAYIRQHFVQGSIRKLLH